MNRRLIAGVSIAVLLGCALVGYFLFVDRVVRKTYQAYVALDGKEPWGPSNQPPADLQDNVIIYRSAGKGVICYDAFHSKFLHDALSSKNGQSVTVEYDTFNDFGKIRGYNVHSIDGIVLANGYHVLQPEFQGTSGVVGTAKSSQACW